MKKRIISLVLLVCILLFISGCSKTGGNSTFSIRFIDVGQGDAALVECDGHYMLIDGGDLSAGDKVCRVLKEERVKRLDILVASHLHEDHIGGLIDVLEYVQKVKLILSNSKEADTKVFDEFNNRVVDHRSKITVPTVGTTYQLGSAEIEVIDVNAEKHNDSLVILISYEETRFLFTGDIEKTAQIRISEKFQEKYQNGANVPFKINLMKVPHHGAYTNQEEPYDNSALYRFLWTFAPDYAIISVGKGNKYQHPHTRTLEMLEDAKAKVYRTDQNGDIIVTVKPNGKELSIETSK